mgnify:CR=1 FL=1
MKKIASFLLLALALTGCYKDKGNYEYTLDSMNEILKVTFSPATDTRTATTAGSLSFSTSPI